MELAANIYIKTWS